MLTTPVGEARDRGHRGEVRGCFRIIGFISPSNRPPGWGRSTPPPRPRYPGELTYSSLNEGVRRAEACARGAAAAAPPISCVHCASAQM
eukprot:scaffold127878_cov96-Phaeocystis_antarctica.AAC.1